MTFKQFIFEGGNFVTGISRIPRDHVMPTAQEVGERLLNKLGLKWHVVGSVGKKESSGDIDIVVDIKGNQTSIEASTVLADLVKKYLPEVTQVKKTNIVSFDFPIAGLNGERCQVDLMPQMDFELGKFVLSKDKFVSILINKIAKIVFPVVVKELPDKKVELRFTYDAVTGLALGKKEYKRVIKKGFPEYTKGKYVSKVPLKNPTAIIAALLGPSATESDIESAKAIVDFITSGRAQHEQIDLNTFPQIKGDYAPYTPEQIAEIVNFVKTELYNS